MDGLRLVEKDNEYRITYCLECGGVHTDFTTTKGQIFEYCIMCGHHWKAVKFGVIKKGEIELD